MQCGGTVARHAAGLVRRKILSAALAGAMLAIGGSVGIARTVLAAGAAPVPTGVPRIVQTFTFQGGGNPADEV